MPTFEGLATEWQALIFVNPPFNDIPWLRKASGSAGHSIVLVPFRPDTRICGSSVATQASSIVIRVNRVPFAPYSKPLPQTVVTYCLRRSGMLKAVPDVTTSAVCP